MPLYENVKSQFIQKDIFLYKISYISVCSKPSEDCALNKKCKSYIYLNNSKNIENN